MKNKKLLAVIIMAASLIISLLLNVATIANSAEAYNNGKRAMYTDLRGAIVNAKRALDAVRPPKNTDTAPAAYNPDGEKHPQIAVGDSLEEFVYNNCTPEVLDAFDQIVDYAERKGINPAMPFAIAWADSQCGQALSTPHNYGNVGNNDRGDRQGFFSAFDGFKAIVDTLNNKYMGAASEVWQLSQGGRNLMGAQRACSNSITGFACYASSEYNWHANVTSALQQIFDLPEPPNNFNYRIWPQL